MLEDPPEKKSPELANTSPALPEGWLAVQSLDLEAQGVAHRSDGKVVFIEGALPFEVVSAQIHRSKNSFEKGKLTEIHVESSQRVRPVCPHLVCMKRRVVVVKCSICIQAPKWL